MQTSEQWVVPGGSLWATPYGDGGGPETTPSSPELPSRHKLCGGGGGCVSNDWFWLNSSPRSTAGSEESPSSSSLWPFQRCPLQTQASVLAWTASLFTRWNHISLCIFLYSYVWIHLPDHSSIPGSIFLYLKILFKRCCVPGIIWTFGGRGLNRSENTDALIKLTAKWRDRHWTRGKKRQIEYSTGESSKTVVRIKVWLLDQ